MEFKDRYNENLFINGVANIVKDLGCRITSMDTKNRILEIECDTQDKEIMCSIRISDLYDSLEM